MNSGFGRLAEAIKAIRGPEPQTALGLTESIAKYLDTRVEERRDDGFHVSSLFRFCPVQWVLSRIAQKERYIPVGDRYRWDVGHAMHRMIRHYLADMGVLKGRWLCENGHVADGGISLKPSACAVCGEKKFWYREIKMEVPVDKANKIVGSTDGIVVVNGEDVGLEIKSVPPGALSGMREPYPYPVYQLRLYMHMLRVTGVSPNLRRGIVLYAAPMDDRVILIPVKTFEIAYEDGPWNEALGKIKRAIALHGDYKAGRLNLDKLVSERVCATRDDGRRRMPPCEFVNEDFGVDGMRQIIEGK